MVLQVGRVVTVGCQCKELSSALKAAAATPRHATPHYAALRLDNATVLAGLTNTISPLGP